MLIVLGDCDESYQALSKWMKKLKLTNFRIKIEEFLETCVLCLLFGHLGQVLKGFSIVDQ